MGARTASSSSSTPDEAPARFVTVWFPDWPVVAAGCPPDVPAAILRGNRIVARTPAAADEGVVIGQLRRQAQQRCPLLELLDDDPARDVREFESVIRAIVDVAPRIDVIEPGWISLPARGPSRYFGGDAALADHLTAVVREHAGHGGRVVEDRAATPVGVGVADGRFPASVAARLAVRRAAPVVVDPGGSPTFCSSLPIGWLQTLGESDPDLVDLFVRLGLRRLGDLAALPATDVLGRFGPEGVHAQKLASGADVRPPNTVDPAPERRLDRVLDDPAAQTDAVVFVAKQLADELAGSLGADGRVCTRLVVLLETEHGERSERSWYRSAGLSAAAMVERVRWQLDGWVNLPRGSDHEITGGVALVRLTPEEVRADDGVQLGLWGGQSEADRRAARAIARLTTLTSESAVTVPVWQGGRLHADRYRWTPATTVDLDDRDAAVAPAEDGSAGPWPGSLPAPSPATVFADVRPIEVLDDAGEVVWVSGRGLVSSPPAAVRALHGGEDEGWRRGPVRSIRSWAGPWPIDQHWWEPDRHRRLARFQVVLDGTGDDTDGEEAVLVVAEHRRWWLTARYD